MAYSSGLYKKLQETMDLLTAINGTTLNKYYDNFNEIQDFPAVIITPETRNAAGQIADYKRFFTEYFYKMYVLVKKDSYDNISLAIDELAYFVESQLLNKTLITVLNYRVFGTTINNLELLGVEVSYQVKI